MDSQVMLLPDPDRYLQNSVQIGNFSITFKEDLTLEHRDTSGGSNFMQGGMYPTPGYSPQFRPWVIAEGKVVDIEQGSPTRLTLRKGRFTDQLEGIDMGLHMNTLKRIIPEHVEFDDQSYLRARTDFPPICVLHVHAHRFSGLGMKGSLKLGDAKFKKDEPLSAGLHYSVVGNKDLSQTVIHANLRLPELVLHQNSMESVVASPQLFCLMPYQGAESHSQIAQALQRTLGEHIRISGTTPEGKVLSLCPEETTRGIVEIMQVLQSGYAKDFSARSAQLIDDFENKYSALSCYSKDDTKIISNSNVKLNDLKKMIVDWRTTRQKILVQVSKSATINKDPLVLTFKFTNKRVLSENIYRAMTWRDSSGVFLKGSRNSDCRLLRLAGNSFVWPFSSDGRGTWDIVDFVVTEFGDKAIHLQRLGPDENPYATQYNPEKSFGCWKDADNKRWTLEELQQMFAGIATITPKGVAEEKNPDAKTPLDGRGADPVSVPAR